MKKAPNLLIILVGLIILFLLGCEEKVADHYSSDFPTVSEEVTRKIQLPAFSLPSSLGDILESKSLKGKTLLVIFFSPTCYDCFSHLAEMETVQDSFAEKGFSVIAIASGSQTLSELVGIRKKLKISYPLLADREASLHKKFGEGIILPVTYMVNNKGFIVKSYIAHPSQQSLMVDIAKMLCFLRAFLYLH